MNLSVEDNCFDKESVRKKLERYLFMALKVAEQSLHISSCGMVAVRVTSLWDSVARSGTAFLKWDVCNFLKLTGRYLEWKKKPVRRLPTGH